MVRGPFEILEHQLLLRPQHSVLRSFRHTEFQNGFGGDFDFLTSGWIAAGSGLPFLLYQFAEAWNGELTLLRFAICEISERRDEVFNLFLADTRLAGHFREDLGLSHLC